MATSMSASHRFIFLSDFTSMDAFASAAYTMNATFWAFTNHQIFSAERMSMFAMGALQEMSKRATSFAVFVRGCQLHVGWIYAAFGFAKMVDLQSFGNKFIEKFPSVSVCACGCPVPPKSSVAIFVFCSNPEPAVGFLDFVAKAFRQIFKRKFSHGLG
jgi:hypothetical protein